LFEEGSVFGNGEELNYSRLPREKLPSDQEDDPMLCANLTIILFGFLLWLNPAVSSRDFLTYKHRDPKVLRSIT
jgi:hypothetical protein